MHKRNKISNLHICHYIYCENFVLIFQSIQDKSAYFKMFNNQFQISRISGQVTGLPSVIYSINTQKQCTHESPKRSPMLARYSLTADQLLDGPLDQLPECKVVILASVVNHFQQLWNAFRVRLRLKLESFFYLQIRCTHVPGL